MKESTSNNYLLKSEVDIIHIRKILRDLCQSLGFGITDITRVVTAVSELSRNIYIYAGTGTVSWQVVEENSKRRGLEVFFSDCGPGIDDIELALQPGFTTRKGLGLGLSGAKRLMDEMEIKSSKGSGTFITVRKWINQK